MPICFVEYTQKPMLRGMTRSGELADQPRLAPRRRRLAIGGAQRHPEGEHVGRPCETGTRRPDGRIRRGVGARIPTPTSLGTDAESRRAAGVRAWPLRGAGADRLQRYPTRWRRGDRDRPRWHVRPGRPLPPRTGGAKPSRRPSSRISAVLRAALRPRPGSAISPPCNACSPASSRPASPISATT
jgi:hypothetical protein